MASPQVEDGHVRIANELLEALMLAGLTAHQWAVTWAVIRKTYGWGQKVDDIALSQLVALTGMDKSNVSRAIKSLVERRILSRADGKYGHVLGLNKNYRQWTGVVKSTTPKTPGREKVVESTTKHGEPSAQSVAAEGTTVVESTTRDEPAVVESTTPVEGDFFGERVVDSETQGCQIGNASVVESTTTKDTYTKDTTTKEKTFAHSLRNEHFDAFWSAYPKKVGKKVARKAFDKVNPNAELLATMLAAIEVRKKSRDWVRGCIHDPATWLNGELWTDEIPTAYTGAQIVVMEAFNESLGEQKGFVEAVPYLATRAGAIDRFVALMAEIDERDRANAEADAADLGEAAPERGPLMPRYFGFVRDKAQYMPKNYGFDEVIDCKTVADAKAGKFTHRE